MNTEEFSQWLDMLSLQEKVRALALLHSSLTVGTRQLFLPDMPQGKEQAVIKMLQGINELHHTVSNWLTDYTIDESKAFPVDVLSDQMSQIATYYGIDGLLKFSIDDVRSRTLFGTALLRKAYIAFNARDIPAALATMQPDVIWPNGIEGGVVHGHEGVRAYWTRQWGMLDPHVDPVTFEVDDAGKIDVGVKQVVRDLSGKVLVDRMVHHVYTLKDGLISGMEIREQ